MEIGLHEIFACPFLALNAVAVVGEALPGAEVVAARGAEAAAEKADQKIKGDSTARRGFEN